MKQNSKKEYWHNWYWSNRENHLQKHNDYQQKWRKTQIGKAFHILSNYNAADKKYGRGEGDLTAQWIVDNIFSKPCAHCGETDWSKIGCNRLDNSKPHTKDNVEPCCRRCNCKLNGSERPPKPSKKVYQYNPKTFQLLNVYNSLHEAANKTNADLMGICRCCNGIQKTSGGFVWSYTQL